MFPFRHTAALPNDKVERHAAALSRPKLLYPKSSIPSDAQRSCAACPLQRKLGGDLNVVDTARRSRNLYTIVPQSLKMELDGFANRLLRVVQCRAGSDAAREIWHVRREIITGSLYDNCVPHTKNPTS
jgi:hypothetical protein